MSVPVENPITESTVAVAERHRQWLRRAVWAGAVFIVAAFLFAIGYPLFVHLQLQQHGWVLAKMQVVGAPPSRLPEWVEPWVSRFDAAFLEKSPVRFDDLDRFQRYPDLKLLGLESTDVSEPALRAMSQLLQLESLQFISVRFDSNGARHLAALPKLEQLSFFQMSLDEAAFEGLGTCTQIKTLTLSSVKLREEDLRHLARMSGLLKLEIHDCDLTDRGLAHIARCKTLSRLELRSSLITDAGISSLAQLDQLGALTLENCGVTDDGAKRIADGLPGLDFLTIGKLPISDAALREFARLPHLSALVLQNVAVTDDGVRQLKSCATLDTLYLEDTKVTGVGVDDLRKSLPTLDVTVK